MDTLFTVADSNKSLPIEIGESIAALVLVTRWLERETIWWTNRGCGCIKSSIENQVKAFPLLGLLECTRVTESEIRVTAPNASVETHDAYTLFTFFVMLINLTENRRRMS